MRVMAIGAHPDDVEFMCAGTLFLLQQAGCEMHIATCTPGDCGSVERPPNEIAEVRREEATRAADMLDADYTCLEERDCRIFAENETVQKAVEAIRRFAPEVVFTHFPEDYMVDHEETSRIVRSATFSAPIPNYSTGAENPAPSMDHIPHLYYWEPMEGKGVFGQEVEPGFHVDITDTVDRKKDMLACHDSQRSWLLRQHGVDEYLNTMMEHARHAGERVGCTYAEGFTQHRSHAYPADLVLEDYVPDALL